MRLMKYSSPSCHSSRSLAPYIIQEDEGGCSDRIGRGRERKETKGVRDGTNRGRRGGEEAEGRREGREGGGGAYRGDCADEKAEWREGWVGGSVGNVGVPQGLRVCVYGLVDGGAEGTRLGNLHFTLHLKRLS